MKLLFPLFSLILIFNLTQAWQYYVAPRPVRGGQLFVFRPPAPNYGPPDLPRPGMTKGRQRSKPKG